MEKDPQESQTKNNNENELHQKYSKLPKMKLIFDQTLL